MEQQESTQQPIRSGDSVHNTDLVTEIVKVCLVLSFRRLALSSRTQSCGSLLTIQYGNLVLSWVNVTLTGTGSYSLEDTCQAKTKLVVVDGK